jgi:hypothetical protein
VVVARGEGHSKRQAEQVAAHNALEDPGWQALTAAREAPESPSGDGA